MTFHRGESVSYCTNCGNRLDMQARFCSRCGAAQGAHQPVETSPMRCCPLCRTQVDPSAFRCPQCAGDIGRLQDCRPCPNCREMIVPMRVVATDEKGRATGFSKMVLGGAAFLSSTEETYTACPACGKPISYCKQCQQLTPSEIERNWVGVGVSKSGYQYREYCAVCGARTT